VPRCTKLSGHGQFSHAFSGEVYDFYSVSPEYFGYNLVYMKARATRSRLRGVSISRISGSTQLFLAVLVFICLCPSTNPLRTKLYLSHLKTQFVPLSKHFASVIETDNLMLYREIIILLRSKQNT
jgi:hypothetical protein